MQTLERLMADIQAVRDCPSTRRLLLDVWAYAQANGEKAGIELGMCVLDGVGVYVDHEKSLKTLVSGGKK